MNRHRSHVQQAAPAAHDPRASAPQGDKSQGGSGVPPLIQSRDGSATSATLPRKQSESLADADHAEMHREEGELPEGWAAATIGDVVLPKVAQDGPANSLSFTYIDISSVNNIAKEITEPKRVPTKEAPSRARQNVRRDDVLVSMTRPNLNAVAMVPDELDRAVASTGFDVLRSTGIAPGWLLLIARSKPFVEAMSELVQGALYPAVRPRDIRDYPICLPPLPEQKRIVAKVEELLARVNTARQRLAKAPAILKRFRQSVLAAACSGQLTADWREADADDWQAFPLSELAIDGFQNGLYVPRTAYGDGTPIVRIADFYDGCIKPWEQLQRVRLDSAQARTYALRDSDILVNRVNSMAFLGKSALVIGLREPSVFESNMMRFAVNARRVLPAFLIRYLNSMQGLEELRANAKQAVNQASINQQDVSAVIVPLPPLPEQHEIVRRVCALFALADKIEARVAAATARVEKITQAILAKAFTGQLVPTEAQLAREEGRPYETAQQLLERIRAQRPEEKGKKKVGEASRR